MHFKAAPGVIPDSIRNLSRNFESRQLLLAMRFTAFILLTACLAASAKGLTQQVTIKVKDASLKEVFKEIKKQTGYTFAYNEASLKEAKKVSLDLRNASIEQVLNICFNGQPFSYEIVDKIVVVKYQPSSPNADATNLTIDDSQLAIDVSGKITDTDNNPLAGATVKVRGTTKGTTTDNNGVFTLKAIDQNAVLEISYVGYEAITIPVNNKTSIVLSLKRNDSKLDEMQVIAYGTKSKRYQTGNVFTVKAEDIAKQPVSNPLLALQGRVPGLFITQTSGFAGSGIKVRIQGVNSIAGGNDPLYVIDGVPFISLLLPAISTTLGTSGYDNAGVSYGNPLNYINPDDIESIEVLKDADATAIYGSQAANGAILITTKKGKPGEQKIDFNFQQGWARVTRRMDMLNLRQYLDMRYEALRNDGINLNTASATDPAFYDLKVWDTTHYTDWQKELIGNTAHYTDLQATISGGSGNTSFSLGTGYHRETSVLPADFNDQKGSVHFQINSSSTDQKFKMRFAGTYVADVNSLPHNVDAGDVTRMAFQLAPNAPALYNPDGGINWALDANGKSTWDYPGNPMAQLLNTYKNKTNNLVGNLLLSYQLIKGLQIKSSFGYNNLVTDEVAEVPLASTAPDLRAATTRIGIYGNSSINSWIIEPHLAYEKNIAGGKLEALLGSTIQQRNSEGQRFHGFGYSNDDVIDDIHAAAKVVTDPSINFHYKYNAAFGRINYNWHQKYILNLTARRDGSSRFGANNQFHNFGSAGGAWIFTEEDFLKNLFSVLSFGKIKASYGTTGSDQIGDYRYFSSFGPVSVGVPYQGITTLTSFGLSNPYLQWEETRKLNVGLDLGFWGDRLLINANYFRNRSSNQLLTYKLPITTGFDGITENFPATVQNSGVELTVNSTNVTSKSFKWFTTFNITIPKNKLVAFPGIESSSYANSLIVGEPITIVKRFHLIGVDPTTGIYYFDSKSNPFGPKMPNDLTRIINTSPQFYGGLQNSFSYKNFQLDFLFQFTKQNGPNYSFGRFPGYTRLNQPVYVLDRWQKPGDVASHQRFNANTSISGAWLNAATISDASFEDASYIRLKNISLSFQLPEAVLKATHLHGLRVYTQAQNLLTLTHYRGLDPETLSEVSLPPLRVVTVGVQITL